MIITNHILASFAIVELIPNPAISLPLAFFSHFFMDGVPHFGYKNSGYTEALRHKLTYPVLVFSVVSSVYILVSDAVVSLGPIHYVAAFLSLLPDLIETARFILAKLHIELPITKFGLLHRNIQTMERPWGVGVELGMLVFLVVALKVIV
jgi:hypothetical protein